MKTVYKYIRFEINVENRNEWCCVNIKHGYLLGIIVRAPRGSDFVFRPESNCEFWANCLADIIDFMNQLKNSAPFAVKQESGKSV